MEESWCDTPVATCAFHCCMAFALSSVTYRCLLLLSDAEVDEDAEDGMSGLHTG